jgi:hypothetical protein
MTVKPSPTRFSGWERNGDHTGAISRVRAGSREARVAEAIPHLCP